MYLKISRTQTLLAIPKHECILLNFRHQLLTTHKKGSTITAKPNICVSVATTTTKTKQKKNANRGGIHDNCMKIALQT